MFRSLYAKLLVIFLAVLMLAMALLSVLLYQRIRADKIEARFRELRTQAWDLAFLCRQMYTSGDPYTQRYLLWKVSGVMRDFDATILVFDSSGQVITIGDEQVVLEFDESMREETQTLLAQVLAGEELLVPAVDKKTGNAIFTVGVPFGTAENVQGGVFIHTSVQSVEASYRDILKSSLSAMLIVLTIGAVSILFVSQYISRPLRAMARAADLFARGDFRERVPVETRDEVGRLAEALNSMAVDLGRLETMRREFVANVSHELRSPLTSMQGFIGGILDGTVPESERQKYLGIVQDETRRLSKLITALLDLSRIESGQAELTKERFDINEMIARVMVRQEARISEKRIDIALSFEAETCFVNADSDRIEQVLVNLIDNAIKFTGEEGHITVSTRRERGTVHVSVRDDGPGIPAEDLPYVLDRFYTANKARTSGSGSGLGLSIARSIIEQHGHRISVSSEPSEGTVFEFTLGGA